MSVLMTRRLTLLASAMLVLAGCAEQATGPGEEPTGLGSDVIALSIEQPPALLPVGFQVPLRARTLRRDGGNSPASVQWSVDRAEMVQIGVSGLDGVARALQGDGLVRISARLGALTTSVQVRVVPMIGRLAVQDQGRFFIVQFDGSPPREVEGPAPSNGISPTWSPDGTHLAFSCTDGSTNFEGRICLTERDGTGRRVIAESDLAYHYGPGWTADGQAVLYSNASGIWQTGLDGTSPTRVALPAMPGYLLGGGRAQPGEGGLVAYEALDTGYSEVNLVCTARSGEGVSGCLEGYGPAWSPDGSSLVANVAYHGGSAMGGLVLLDPVLRSGRTLIPQSDSYAFAPTWSPDGQWIAFGRHLSSDGVPRTSIGIWAVRPDGTNLVQLAFGTMYATGPAWGR